MTPSLWLWAYALVGVVSVLAEPDADVGTAADDGGLNANEGEAQAFLDKYNAEYGDLLNRYTIASWNYETNLTDENAAVVVGSFFLFPHKETNQFADTLE